MTNQNLLALILGDEVRITQAITTGAAWEVWMQVELVVLLLQAGLQAARELPYPPPNSTWRLDIGAQDSQGQYAIELKVESATNAGAALLNSVQQDIVKIPNYTPLNPGARWVVGIGYSSQARGAMYAYASSPANHAIYNEVNSIGVLIVTV